MRLNFSVPVVALLAGAAIGFCLHPAPKAVEGAGDAPPGPAAPAAGRPIADAAGDAATEALRARIKELETLLADAAKRSDEKPEPPGEDANDGRRERVGFRNFREEMERMKAEEPERYAQITNQMARARLERAKLVRSKLDFLVSIDPDALASDDARDTHSRLQSLIARREELEEMLHGESVSDEERGEIVRELISGMGELGELYSLERDSLLAVAVGELGIDGPAVDDVVAVINDIIDATSMGFGPPRHGGGPGPRGQAAPPR